MEIFDDAEQQPPNLKSVIHFSRPKGRASKYPFKIVEVRKRVRNENCHQDAIKRIIKHEFTLQIPFWTLFMERAKTSDLSKWQKPRISGTLFA